MHFAESLIRLSDRTGRGMYELTTDAENHGDTEWHYDVFFTADGEAPAVRGKCRKWSNDKGWEYQLGGDVRMFRSYLAQWMRGMLLTVRANRAQRAMLTL